MGDCIFCTLKDSKEKICENDSFYALFDIKPVTRGHALIITKRHMETIFELDENESRDFPEILKQAKKAIDEKYHPVAYNLGGNNGREAGQLVMHCHLHLIPRYGQGKDPPTVSESAEADIAKKEKIARM